MTVYVSLLRAINVGGHAPIPMARLREVYESLGLTAVQSLLQSGNVVFASKEDDRKRLIGRIQDALASEFAARPEIILRTAPELREIVEHNPFPAVQEASPNRLLVYFLAEAPGGEAQARLREQHAGPEEIECAPQELFLHYSNGIGRSKLTNVWIEKRLGTLGTARNWNTVTKLLDLTNQVR